MTASSLRLANPLVRQVFSTPRAAEYLDPRGLQALTGQPIHRFAEVVLKELLDNGLDAAESAGAQPELSITTDTSRDQRCITVTDNGTGLPPDVVTRVLDFTRLVSDKAAYRSPTRGLQGNALKTVLGIPAALGARTPVVIEACGVRHEVALELDPAGAVVVHHTRQPSVRSVGTAITVTLPASRHEDLHVSLWVKSFALVNPHSGFNHAYSDQPEAPDFYKPTVRDGWRKPAPTDPLEIHWHDEAALARLVFAHIGATRNGGRDLPLGEFVRRFAGLTSTAKARKVTAAVPGITHLSGFEHRRDQIPTLLEAMRAECRPATPGKLGQVPEDHYRECFDTWYGVNRWWFKRARLTDNAGQPWVIEAAVANTDSVADAFYAVNYSASFGDPLGRTELHAGDVTATGSASFLARCDAYPNHTNNSHRAVVVHLISPAVEFVDKGKVALAVPPAVADAAAGVLAQVGKVLRKERESAARDARRRVRHHEQQTARETPKGMSLREAVFRVIPEAFTKARGPEELPVSDRSLYYQIRPLIQSLTDKDLTQHYCSTLVVDYQREHGTLDGLYYEPRGVLHEPHTGAVVQLGTREVRTYTPPEWTYDKILYIEKQGLYPVLEESGLGERHDMAIIAGEGYAATACRDLLTTAASRQWRIFVLHDADPHGYGIARTLAEATARMPDHSIEVTDLGLTADAAIEHGLPTEYFTRRKALPSTLRLNETEKGWFTGTQTRWGDKPEWRCTRVELNAFTGPQLIAHIEAGLAAHGATAKVIPSPDVLAKHAAAVHHAMLGVVTDELLRELVSRDRLLAVLRDEFPYQPDPTGLAEHVRATLDAHRQRLWREPTAASAAAEVERQRAGLRSRLTALLRESGWSA